MAQPYLAQDQSAAQLLERAEARWGTIRGALYNPEEWEDQEWTSAVMDLGALYELLGRIQPSTSEEEARFRRLLTEIREAARTFGFNPPPEAKGLQ